MSISSGGYSNQYGTPYGMMDPSSNAGMLMNPVWGQSPGMQPAAQAAFDQQQYYNPQHYGPQQYSMVVQQNAKTQQMSNLLNALGLSSNATSTSPGTFSQLDTKGGNLMSLLNGSGSNQISNSDPSLDNIFSQVQNTLSNQQAQRQNLFSDGSFGRVNSTDNSQMQGLMGNVNDMMNNGYNAQSLSAIKSQAQEAQNTSYLQSLRQMKGVTSQNGLGVSGANNQRANLIQQNLRAQSDLNQGLAVNQTNFQQQMANLYGQLIGQDRSNSNQIGQFNAGQQQAERIAQYGNPQDALNAYNNMAQNYVSDQSSIRSNNTQRMSQQQALLQNLMSQFQ